MREKFNECINPAKMVIIVVTIRIVWFVGFAPNFSHYTVNKCLYTVYN